MELLSLPAQNHFFWCTESSSLIIFLGIRYGADVREPGGHIRYRKIIYEASAISIRWRALAKRPKGADSDEDSTPASSAAEKTRLKRGASLEESFDFYVEGMKEVSFSAEMMCRCNKRVVQLLAERGVQVAKSMSAISVQLVKQNE